MLVSIPSQFAASFAALPATPLPLMSLRHGTHLILVEMFRWLTRDWILWNGEMRTT
jgi:hypothetical protein